MNKRILAALLSAIMIFNSCPVSVWAEGEQRSLESTDTSEELIVDEKADEVPDNEILAEPTTEESTIVEPVTEEIESVTEELLQMESSTIVHSGWCGANRYDVTWTLDDTGTLTLSGQGGTKNYGVDVDREPGWIDWDADIKTIVVEDGITYLGEGTFIGLHNAETAYLGSDITEIPRHTFYRCESLKNIYFEGEITKIDGHAFDRCRTLTSFEVPSTVLSIGYGAFTDCYSLSSVVLNDGLQTIGSSAFANTLLTEITIPASVTQIETTAFDIKTLETIEVDSNNEYYTSVDGVLYNADETQLLVYPAGKSDIKSFTIPSSVTVIADYAFHDAIALETVTLPKGLTTIGKYAFCDAIALQSLVIPQGVTTIGEGAFQGADVFSTINIPDSVKSIGRYSFYDTDLTDVFYGGTQAQWNKLYVDYTGIGTATIHYNCYDSKIKDSGTCGENVEWTLYEDGRILISGTGAMTDYSTNSGAPPWNQYDWLIKKAVIDEGITHLGHSSFYGCSKLAEVVLPDSLLSIGNDQYWGAFMHCESLTSIDLPSNLTYIGGDSFYGTGLTSIYIPPYVTEIGKSAFSWCKSLTYVSLPSGLTTIGENAFTLVPIESISLPSSLKQIGDQAFYSSHLTKVTIPAAVESIGYQAFDCSTLTAISVDSQNTHYCSIDGVLYNKAATQLIQCPCTKSGGFSIPDSVTSIGDYAFSSCEKLSSITIPNDVTSIGDYAFSSCEKLSSITIPNGVTLIDYCTFSNCENLSSITIPNSVTTIDYRAFEECTALTDVYYDGTEEEWNAIVINGGNDPLINATIHLAEAGPPLIDSGTCGENLTWTLTEEGVLTICGEGAMSYTRPWIDYNSNIISVIIEDGVTSIVESAFSGCINLSAITIPDSVTSIGNNAFSNCSSLTSITIPDSVTSIGVSAFYKCSSLTSITIPNRVRSIEGAVFHSCSNLTSITIPDRVTSIGNSAFSFCSSLTSITIPDSVTSIGNSAFSSCSSLTDITIPDGVKLIGSSVFSFCRSLTSITIPDGVTSIGDYAFSSCSGLTSITIPGSVRSIGDYAFSFCTALTDVYYGGTETEWNQITIGTNDYLTSAIIHYNYGASEPVMKPVSLTMSLDGYIGLNVYMELSEDVVADEGSYMRFVVAGKEQKVYTKDATVKTNTSGTRYGFQCKLNAKQMTEDVKMQMVLSDGRVGKEYTKRVTSYTDQILKNSGNEDVKPLVKAVLNYGAYAQKQFNYRTAELANAGLSEAEKTAINAVSLADVTGYTNSTAGSVEGLKVKSVSLLVESGTVLRFYFTVSEGHDISEYQFVRSDTGEVLTAEATEEAGRYSVDIENIISRKLDDSYSIRVNDSYTVTSSALSYVRSVLKNPASYAETMQDIAKALYLYNQEANEYFGD